MRIALCAYNWIGCKALHQLVNAGHEVCVFTHKEPYYVNSVFDYATDLNLFVATDRISTKNLPFTPDIVCSVYYRFIIQDDVIDLVKGKAFNVHPSLLPRYRGCSSLTWAMIKGEAKVGFTYHYLTAVVDQGNILLQTEVPLFPFDTQATVYHRVMVEAATEFDHVLKMVMQGDNGVPQDISEGEYFPRGCPYGGEIDARWSNEEVQRFIRAMNFPPLPPAKMLGRRFEIEADYSRVITSLERDDK